MQTCYNFSQRERNLAFSSSFVKSLWWEKYYSCRLRILRTQGWKPLDFFFFFSGGILVTILSRSKKNIGHSVSSPFWAGSQLIGKTILRVSRFSQISPFACFYYIFSQWLPWVSTVEWSDVGIWSRTNTEFRVSQRNHSFPNLSIGSICSFKQKLTSSILISSESVTP